MLNKNLLLFTSSRIISNSFWKVEISILFLINIYLNMDIDKKVFSDLLKYVLYIRL